MLKDYGNSARTHSLADVGDGGFASAYEKARGASRISTYKSHEPGAIEIAILARYAINPGRVKKGRHTPEERDRAERLTRWWASTWLPDVVDWIELSHGEHRDVAVRLSQLGLTAADAALKLGFGRIDPSAPRSSSGSRAAHWASRTQSFRYANFVFASRRPGPERFRLLPPLAP